MMSLNVTKYTTHTLVNPTVLGMAAALMDGFDQFLQKLHTCM
jgi:hypothetical protein